MSEHVRRSGQDFLVFGAPAIEDAEINEVIDSLKSGWLGTGPKVARFESEFADYKGVKHIGLQTVSLPISAKLSDQEVDEVIESVSSIIGR